MHNRNLLLKNIGILREECRSKIREINDFLSSQGKETVAWKDPGNLQVALFGQYNAGKSTLVNAFLREARATMGDSPETKVANSYNWQGYTIIDLPGRNARKDEDERAISALTDAHVALYVVSSGQVDHDTIWSDIKFLYDQAIPYIFVINDKQRHQDDDVETRYREMIIEQFVTIAKRQGCGFPNDLYWVNAHRAFEARLQDKMLLEKKSGIIPLEEKLADFIFRHDGLLHDMAELKKVLSLLKQFKVEFLQSTHSDEITEFSDQLSWCADTQEKLQTLAWSIAEEQFNPLRESIAATYEQAINTGQGQGVQTEVRTTIAQCWQAATEAYRGRAKAELSANIWSLELDDEGTFFDQFMSTGPEDYSVPQIGAGSSQFDNCVKEVLRRAGADLNQAPQPKIIGLKQLLPGGKKNVDKYLGPAVQVATAAWDIYQGYKKVQGEEQLRRTALKKANADADMAVAMVKQMFLGQAVSFAINQLSSIRAEANSRMKEVRTSYKAEQTIITEISAHQAAVQTLMTLVNNRCRGV